jgi:DNA-binding transcriptional LysR family regulator
VIESFDKYDTRLNISVELPSLEAIKRLVESGVGVALVPKLTAKAEIANGQLAGMSVKEMKLERKLNIIYRKNSVLSHASQEFLKIAREMNK